MESWKDAKSTEGRKQQSLKIIILVLYFTISSFGQSLRNKMFISNI